MVKQGPEQESFKVQDKVDDTQTDSRTAEAFQLDAYARAGNDQATKQEPCTDKVVSPEVALSKVLPGIVERAARLPEALRQQVIASSEGFIDPTLLNIVKNPHEFKLGDQQDPQDVLAFLARVQDR
ncbi:MAG: hypothetical protein HY711_03170 [Candidatus Melainabacteria bacterium]|nr:hypothetical protein [Candidatus Melainabacteria bacterium]